MCRHADLGHSSPFPHPLQPSAPQNRINDLGLDPAPTIQRFTLVATDRVLLYTDGLMEARSPDGRQFELDGQVQAVGAAPSLGTALDGLVARLLDHAGGRLDDDLALVLAQPRL